VRDRDRMKQRIGVQLQAGAYFDYLTLEEILDLFGSFYPKQVPPMALLEKVGLSEKRKALVKELSGGQAQRFSIVASMVNDPDVVFLDEPTTGLDPVSRRRIRALVSGLRESGTTVVLTSHDLTEVQELADRVDVIRDGAFIASGTPDDLVRGSAAFTVVEFAEPEGVDGRLPEGAELVNGRARILTDDHDAVVERVQAWARDEGTRISGLTIVPPSLDDAYVAMLENGTGQNGAAGNGAAENGAARSKAGKSE
jgi:ABC-2 type transport system ATP-binding protein